MLTHVDLFSGIGGFSLACQWAGVETIAFAEIDKYASRVLERRFPRIRNYGDVRNVPPLAPWLITAGTPCQGFSIAGRRKGKDDHRYLWPETLAIVERDKPAWFLNENVTNVIGMVLDEWHSDLESIGYEAQSFDISAACSGLSTMERHVWTVATPYGQRSQRGISGQVSRLREVARQLPRSDPRDGERWAVPEARVCRVAERIPYRVERNQCLGNAIPPITAYEFIKRIIEVEAHNAPASRGATT